MLTMPVILPMLHEKGRSFRMNVDDVMVLPPDITKALIWIELKHHLLVVIFITNTHQLMQIFLKMRPVFAVIVNVGTVAVRIAIEMRIWRIITQLWIFGDPPDGVHAHAVHAHIKPKSHHIFDGQAHLRIVPVEIWLGW